jgi:hypothetical protein
MGWSIRKSEEQAATALCAIAYKIVREKLGIH